MSSPLRIGIVCYPTIGGSGIVATELGLLFAAAGHEVHFISYERPVRLGDDTPNLRFHPVIVNEYTLFKYPDYTLPLSVRIAEVSTEFRLDILHVHYAVPHATAALLARLMLGDGHQPVLITTLHGTDTNLLGNDANYRPIIRHSIENSCGVTTVSESLRQQTIDTFGITKPITVIPNFFKPSTPLRDRATVRRDLGLRADDILLLHLSNLRPGKRVTDILQAIARAKSRARLRFVILAGDDFTPYQAEVATLGLTDQVTSFEGVQSIDDFLNACDLGIYASEQESFGLSILETLAHGHPVIATDVGGIPEVIRPNETGLLVPPHKPTALATAIDHLVENPTLRATLGECRPGRRCHPLRPNHHSRLLPGFLPLISMITSRPNPLNDQIAFPVLTTDELDATKAFGTCCSFPAGEPLFEAGDQPFDAFVIIEGDIVVLDISNDERDVVIEYGAGHFTGDIDLLTGRPAVVRCEAVTDVRAVRIAPRRIREMFIQAPILGEKLWLAFQRRRELLLATDFRGIRVFGHRNDPATLQMVEFLYRNGVPNEWLDAAEAANVDRLTKLVPDRTPSLPALSYGPHLIDEAPTLMKMAEHIGLRHHPENDTHDVLIIGSGPSGLGAAVYAASEGLSTLVLDGLGPGGQAGSSSKIENYAGFPNGIAGRELAQLTYLQALKFGADFVAPCNVTSLTRRDDGLYEVRTCENDVAVGRTVIISTGVSYRILDVDGLDDLKGAGIYYNATKVEALLCKDCPVHIVGAGNSAGQAAMFLSQFATEVHLLVRGDNLTKSMSSYLSDRVIANPKIQVRYGTQISAVHGTVRLEAVTLKDKHGNTTREGTSGLFIFIGAKPRTDFLPEDMCCDDKGFLLTGTTVTECGAWKEDRLPRLLETSYPGVFASGDCRSGTTKRVAFAIGDGSLAVTCVHDILGTYA